MLFDQQGYEGATTCAIAERAGVSEATLFRYFPTKADLALATIRDRIDSLVEALTGRPDAESPYEAVRAVAGGEAARRFLDGLMVRDGRRVATHPELAARLYWLLIETRWRLAADFAPRMRTDRWAVSTRLAADAVVDAVIVAAEKANREDAPERGLSWFLDALSVVRPVLEAPPRQPT